MNTFPMFLFLIIMTSSMAAAVSDNDACDLTMDGTLGSMRGWFWSSASSSSCSQQSDCVKNVECCQDEKCTWVDWVAPLIFTFILLVVSFSSCASSAAFCLSTSSVVTVVVKRSSKKVYNLCAEIFTLFILK